MFSNETVLSLLSEPVCLLHSHSHARKRTHPNCLFESRLFRSHLCDMQRSLSSAAWLSLNLDQLFITHFQHFSLSVSSVGCTCSDRCDCFSYVNHMVLWIAMLVRFSPDRNISARIRWVEVLYRHSWFSEDGSARF